jgi:hypothetical protein
MAADRIFSNWDDTHSVLWGHAPIRLAHNMHKSPLFSMDHLAALIENYPREHYSLMQTGVKGDKRIWRHGDIGNFSGHQVIDAISRGDLWLNLRMVSDIDQRYSDLLAQMFAEIGEKVPHVALPHQYNAGILLSAPKAQVHYHADLPGQSLIQIAGRKRVHIYPSNPPFVTPKNLEDIQLFELELDMPYHEWYDRYATVLDLEPGQMLNWPLNAPHRVDNLGTVNISMTVGYENEEIRRTRIVNLANGLLRNRFGYTPKSRSLKGPAFWGKAVMQKALRNTSWVKRERKARNEIEFRLDHDHPEQVVDLLKAA